MVLEKSPLAAKERNYGIDLLRIVAMFMVLFLHILGNGGILFEVNVLSPHGIIAWFFEMATFSAINCYGVISGYVGVDSRYKYSSAVTLWLQIAAYSVLIALVYHLRYPQAVSLSSFLTYFFPVCTKKYWYVTAYFGMFFLSPVLNKGAQALTKGQFKATLTGIFITLSVLPSVFSNDIFMTGWGYGMLWLSFLYLMGAYIKMHGFFKNSIKISGAIYLLCVIFSWAVKLWEENASTADKYAYLSSGFVAQYTSPPMFLAGVALVVIFSQLKLNKTAKKIVALVSPCAFGVYIIHAHPLLWDRLITYRYAHFINYNPFVMILAVFAVAFIMFTVLAFVDFIRLRIFKLLHIKPFVQKIENKITGDLWN